jgi:predicted nucleic acid-binding protein
MSRNAGAATRRHARSEDGSDRAELIWSSADAVASVSLIALEARAAIAAAGRGRRLSVAQARHAVGELDALLRVLHLMPVTDELVSAAGQLADVEGLRGYDAVHLAAALEIGATVLGSADTALCAAAERRGLHVANPVIT